MRDRSGPCVPNPCTPRTGRFRSRGQASTRAPGTTAEPKAATYNWTGAYVGFNTGAALGTYHTSKTTTPSPTYLFSPADVAAVNAAGQQQITRPGFTGGVQAGYNWQFGRALLGIEADLNYLHMGGATTSGAVKYPVGSGFNVGGIPLNQFIVYSYADADWLLTLRPRVGITADNWLFYATGGLALTHLKGELLFADGNAAGDLTGAAQEADVNTWKAGYTVGGGVETAISNRLRLKAEYSFVDFGTVQPHETSSNLATFFAPPASQTFSQSMKLQMHLFRLGLNYSFSGADSGASGSEAWASLPYAAPLPWPTNAARSDWEFDVGARTWFSSGTVGAPQALLGAPPLPSSIISRLTYENVQALSGETFARVDHRSGPFVKGFIGAGGVSRGTLVDEDFPGGTGLFQHDVPAQRQHRLRQHRCGVQLPDERPAQGSAPSSDTTTTPNTSMDSGATRSPAAPSARHSSIPTTRCSAKTSATTRCASGYPPSSC